MVNIWKRKIFHLNYSIINRFVRFQVFTTLSNKRVAIQRISLLYETEKAEQ